MECVLQMKNMNTDLSGTFTGALERLDDVSGTARNKCRLAMKISNCDMAVASDGSFGSHPTFGF